ncbi:MAG: hypothetical protein CMI16_13645 [Opitutaceae bacterium]|nr:hypothetical protein [Opitutaceae bacterium]|tara:strand:+ start:699 stop:1049 length:351 start_codon:yes stop_codon:yes gene_type:complete
MRPIFISLPSIAILSFAAGAPPEQKESDNTQITQFKNKYLGAVVKQGKYLINPETTVRDAIKLAGGTLKTVWPTNSKLISGPEPYTVVSARDDLEAFLSTIIPPNSVLYLAEHLPY